MAGEQDFRRGGAVGWLLGLLVWMLASCTSDGAGPGVPREGGRGDEATQALLAQGVEALHRQAYDVALALADSAAGQALHAADAFFLRGRALSEMQRLDEADAAYRRAAALRPDYPGLWHNLANNALRRQQFDAAVALYRRELRRLPTAVSWRGIGRAYVELGRPDSARYAFEQAIALDDAYVPAYLNLVLLLEGQGRLDEALPLAERALALDPQHPELRYAVGSVLARAGRTEAALPLLRSVTAQWPWHHAAHYALGQALLRLGRAEEARTYLGRADTLRALQAKVSYLEEAVRTQPDDPDAHAALGAALRHAGRYEEALGAFRTALYLRPQAVALRHAVATLHMLRGDEAAAVQAFTVLLRQDSTVVEAWLNLGLVHAAAGRTPAARQAWRQALRYRPEHPAARAYLARLDANP